MQMTLNKLALLLVAVSSLQAYTNVNTCYAQFQTDSAAPIEITADSMEWLNEKKIAIARGNADAVQGRYTLSAHTLTAHITSNSNDGSIANGSTSNSQISLIEAEGNVLLTTPNEKAWGNTGTYDVRNKTATLVGAVVLTQGETVLHGEKLVMDLNTGHSRLDGMAGPAEPDGDGRVKAIFNPETAEEQ
jgi:lipopolysaccharide export system protein LptA